MASGVAQESTSGEKSPTGVDASSSSNIEAPKQLENAHTHENLSYCNIDEEPEIHRRTYAALLAIFMLNFVTVLALQGPPAVLSYIATSLNGTPKQNWVPIALSLVQAVLSPMFSSASDTFQARKAIIIGSSLIAFIGAAIAPGAKNIDRLIAAQALIGVGYSSAPLGYAIPSETLPRRWRPLAQALVNIAAALASIVGPLIIGALTRADPVDGWRNFYWLQMAVWGVTILALFFGYRPPKRHTNLDHLSFWQKVATLDLPGCGLLAIGLSLTLTGLTLGGNQYSWKNAQTLSTLCVGLVFCIIFGVYEWKCTSTGFLHHDLFRGGKAKGRTFAICCGLFAVEALLVFAFTIFYPVLTQNLFTQDPFLLAARATPNWLGAAITTVAWAWVSTRFRTIRAPLLIGFIIWTGGTVALATIQPGQGLNALTFAAMSGIGSGAPLILIIAGVQLSTPPHLVATATAVAVSGRALTTSVFTAIYSAIVNSTLPAKISSYVTAAALEAGLPPSSLPLFIPALTGNNDTALQIVPGATVQVITAGVGALQQASADSIRLVYILAACLGAVGCIGVLFISDMRAEMDYFVQAPVEDLHAKHPRLKEGTEKV
ncbi:uncharacterized protein DNG_00042 [Cephalotrichum gorgonifer]|uniref:Major facilitator superfamily (MFS) profile domain-containing protein n=1 Tax=Cephalotrichum gorgonifer TaxID=2041049 RepID=A0AAE8MNK9_9PEZI|nr:uncharacterized protein DNG_00042 [Cephalotrichum gorgonifer]